MLVGYWFSKFLYLLDCQKEEIILCEKIICIKKGQPKLSILLLSDSYRIQTYNLLIRSQMLYSVELRSHCFSQLRCKGTAFF